MWYYDDKWFSIQILTNPKRTLKKLKGVFKPAKLRFRCGFGKQMSKPFLYAPMPSPITIRVTDVEWKDKDDTPRYEDPPHIWIYFFGLNLMWWWEADDEYWEMALWYLFYNSTNSQGQQESPDITKARESWPWEDVRNNQSTWNDEYLLKT